MNTNHLKSLALALLVGGATICPSPPQVSKEKEFLAQYKSRILYFPMSAQSLVPISYDQMMRSSDISSLCNSRVDEWVELMKKSPISTAPFEENIRLIIFSPKYGDIVVNFDCLVKIGNEVRELSRDDYMQIRRNVISSMPEQKY